MHARLQEHVWASKRLLEVGKKIEIIKKYPSAEHMLHKKHTTECHETKLIETIPNYYSQVVE